MRFRCFKERRPRSWRNPVEKLHLTLLRNHLRGAYPRRGYMTVGMTPFTLFHVLISLIGIFSGLIAVFGMIARKRLDGWTALFLSTTALTSITGFFFPFHKLLPSHILGIISLFVLAFAIPARYFNHLEG